ncbi:MAG: hypothetical protein QNJ64_04855 [Crocosphaera sp.]|nr:hypothetical protein [Crocosphaera sp.]
MERLLVPVDKLSQEKDQMFALLTNHFLGVNRERFEEDLNGKNWVILLKEKGQLKGFSTLQCYETTFKGESVKIVYSGDTITDPSMWSSPALSQAWAKVIQTFYQEKSQKIYWLLISSGYRTYRFMSIFWRKFYPCYQWETPPEIADFINYLAQKQFKQNYDAHHGIIRFPKPQILRPHLQQIPQEKLKDPHVAFFLKKNPSHGQGDELVCLTEISTDNLTRAGLRLWNNKTQLLMPFSLSYC